MIGKGTNHLNISNTANNMMQLTNQRDLRDTKSISGSNYQKQQGIMKGDFESSKTHQEPRAYSVNRGFGKDITNKVLNSSGA